MKAMFNFNNYGGSPFLGARKIVVKTHGASDSTAFLVAIDQVIAMHKNKLCEKIEKEVAKLNVTE